jgi:hypothetical protein
VKPNAKDTILFYPTNPEKLRVVLLPSIRVTAGSGGAKS